MAKNKTGAKKTAQFLSICVALGITIGVTTGAVIVRNDREERYKKAAVEFVDHTLQSDKTLYLDEETNDYALSKYRRNTTISRGEYIVDEIESRDILYCEFLDQYYTKEGKPLAFIDEYDESGRLISTEMIVIENLSEPITVKNNQYIRLINTKPYSEIANKDLVVRMSSKIKYDGMDQEMYLGNIVFK